MFLRHKAVRFSRNGVVRCKASLEEVFPLLCPKMEEKWIPGWECETIWSESGYNEEGAIFKTVKPYDTELYWATVRHDIKNKIIAFLITAPELYIFDFKLELEIKDGGVIEIAFIQTFTSVSEDGDVFLHRYELDDFKGKLKKLEEFLNDYLAAGRNKTGRDPD